MKPIRVGLVADPAAPTQIAHQMSDLSPPDEDRNAWDVEVVSEPFTIGSENVDNALGRLGEEARKHEWDLVVGLTELPLRDDHDRFLLVETDPNQRRAVLSLPALGGLRLHARARHTVRDLVSGMADRSPELKITSPCLDAVECGDCWWAWCWPTVRGCSYLA